MNEMIWYLNSDRSFFTEDGQLRSGDIGRRNPDGSMNIIDRIKNLVELRDGPVQFRNSSSALELVELNWKFQCPVPEIPNSSWTGQFPVPEGRDQFQNWENCWELHQIYIGIFSWIWLRSKWERVIWSLWLHILEIIKYYWVFAADSLGHSAFLVALGHSRLHRD